MTSIKNYFKNYIKDIIFEVLKEPESKFDVSEYVVRNSSNDNLNVWDVMKSPYCTSIKLKAEYINEGFPQKIALEKPPGDFFRYLDDFTLPDNVLVTGVSLFVRYDFKGDRNLVIHNFTYYSKKYNPDILIKIKKELLEWYEEHPELKL